MIIEEELKKKNWSILEENEEIIYFLVGFEDRPARLMNVCDIVWAKMSKKPQPNFYLLKNIYMDPGLLYPSTMIPSHQSSSAKPGTIKKNKPAKLGPPSSWIPYPTQQNSQNQQYLSFYGQNFFYLFRSSSVFFWFSLEFFIYGEGFSVWCRRRKGV